MHVAWKNKVIQDAPYLYNKKQLEHNSKYSLIERHQQLKYQ
jgi:hypothetical protein